MAASVVDRDVPCRKCAYNLRSLPVDGRCPECGSPVGLSLQGDLLRFSDPKWLQTLRRGVNFILYAVMIVIIWIITYVIVAFSAPEFAAKLDAIGPAIGILISVLFIGGAWLLTMPDPSGIGEDRYGTARKVIRVTSMASIFDSFENLAKPYIHNQTALMVLILLAALAMLMGVVGFFAQTSYLCKLALRIPDEKMSKRAKFLMYAIGIPYVVMALRLLIMALAAQGFGWRMTRGGIATFGCTMGIVGLMFFIFGLGYLRMLTNFAKRLQVLIGLAQHTWGTGPAGSY